VTPNASRISAARTPTVVVDSITTTMIENTKKLIVLLSDVILF